MSSRAKWSFWLVWVIPLLFLLPGPAATQPQQEISQTTSVTGCLRKGEEPGGFFIVEQGRMWELFDKIDAQHAGKTVRVSGRFIERTDAEEAKLLEYEKKEAQGLPYADFEVTSLEVIKNSCN